MVPSLYRIRFFYRALSWACNERYAIGSHLNLSLLHITSIHHIEISVIATSFFILCEPTSCAICMWSHRITSSYCIASPLRDMRWTSHRRCVIFCCAATCPFTSTHHITSFLLRSSPLRSCNLRYAGQVHVISMSSCHVTLPHHCHVTCHAITTSSYLTSHFLWPLCLCDFPPAWLRYVITSHWIF